MFSKKGDKHMVGRLAVISAPDITRAKGDAMNIQSKQATFIEAATILKDRLICPEEIAEALNPLRRRCGLPPYPEHPLPPESLLPYSLATLQQCNLAGWYLVYSHGAVLRNIYAMRGKNPPIGELEECMGWPRTYLRPKQFHLVYLGRQLKGLAEEARNIAMAKNFHNCERASAVLTAYAFTAIKKTRDRVNDVGGFYYTHENIVLALSGPEDKITFFSRRFFMETYTQGKDVPSALGISLRRIPDYA